MVSDRRSHEEAHRRGAMQFFFFCVYVEASGQRFFFCCFSVVFPVACFVATRPVVMYDITPFIARFSLSHAPCYVSLTGAPQLRSYSIRFGSDMVFSLLV